MGRSSMQSRLLCAPLLFTIVACAIATATGCRSLPRSWDPPEPTYAVAPTAEGPLAEFAQACSERLETDQSGFMFVKKSSEALRWRLALVDSAHSTIDVQTFLWRGDDSGRLLMYRIKLAADRGVRARLLVDDWMLRGKDHVIAALNDHPNIEIRIWNPGRNRELGRKLEFLTRLSELNYRMHNKLFVVDNQAAISGGRNIGDEYFGLSKNYNMLDLDLLAVGPIVEQASQMFDRYWNATQAAPARIFDRGASVDDLPRLMAPRLEQLRASPIREVFGLDPQDWDDLLADAATSMISADAEVIYDRPGEREPSQDALFGLQRFFQRAKREVISLNPYLVPSEAFLEEARRLEEAGVDMAIMTNSLGSNNMTVVHHAYARTRRPMIQAGVDVHELRWDGDIKAEIDTPPIESQFICLHAKAVVIDRRDVFIGSFNFSPRSRNLNTEMGLLVHSSELGEQVADYLSKCIAPENAWQVHIGADGGLLWESRDGTLTSQPSQSFWQEFGNVIYSFLPVEEHL